MHGYAPFAEFGAPMNSAVGPKKCQTHLNAHSMLSKLTLINEKNNFLNEIS